MLAPVARHKIYYKGKVVASPKSRPWWILWIHVCSWFVHALTNLLFRLCRFMWVIELLINLPSPHLRAIACPSTPEVLWAKERIPTPYFSIVFTLDSRLNLSRSSGARQHNNHTRWNIEKHHDLERPKLIKNQIIPQPLMHVFNHKNLKLEITNRKSTSETKPTFT